MMIDISPPPPPGTSDDGATWDADLSDDVSGRVRRLAAGYLRDDARTVRSLAVLRRALGRPPGSEPDAWAETLDGFPRHLQGRGDTPSPSETAAHLAITVFALHQQSKRRDAMHEGGRPFGAAIRTLGRRSSAENAVLRRFQMLGTAGSFTETAHHLRGLVTQLRGEGIPLDYGQLAVDLRRLQDPRTADGVRLRWGREYHRSPHSDLVAGAPPPTGDPHAALPSSPSTDTDTAGAR